MQNIIYNSWNNMFLGHYTYTGNKEYFDVIVQIMMNFINNVKITNSIDEYSLFNERYIFYTDKHIEPIENICIFTSYRKNSILIDENYLIKFISDTFNITINNISSIYTYSSIMIKIITHQEIKYQQPIQLFDLFKYNKSVLTQGIIKKIQNLLLKTGMPYCDEYARLACSIISD